MRRDRSATAVARRSVATYRTSAQLGDAADGLERGEGARTLLRFRLGRCSQRVADVEEHLEQELFALIGGVEGRHALLVPRGGGALVGFAIHRLDVRENAVACAR